MQNLDLFAIHCRGIEELELEKGCKEVKMMTDTTPATKIALFLTHSIYYEAAGVLLDVTSLSSLNYKLPLCFLCRNLLHIYENEQTESFRCDCLDATASSKKIIEWAARIVSSVL
jgi:hypothetical protein